MKYCVEQGIPHDNWLAWEPESRSKHIAYLLFESEICQLCGTAQWEWEENKYAYEPVEVFCKGCHLKEVASDSNPNSLPGTTTSLTAVNEDFRVGQFLAHQRIRNMDFSDTEAEGT